jgi:hypothetical protein
MELAKGSVWVWGWECVSVRGSVLESGKGSG